MYGGISDPSYVCLTTLYVSPSGSDSNPGTETSPRLFSAATLAMGGPGVGLCCLDGTYVGGHTISHGGNADTLTGYFAIFSKKPRGAKFVPDPAHPTFNLFDLTASTASYVILDGLDIQGPLPSVSGGSAIEFKSHHIKILDCALHDSAACGLQAASFDYLLLQGCDISGNAGSGNGNIIGGGYSGVSLLGPIAFDNLPGWHVVARFNRIWKNTEGPLVTVAHSDGNGFILDSWGVHGYGQATLIEGNLVVGNGRRGIEVLKAYQGGVTVRSNTCCNNNQDTSSPGTGGEIAIWHSPSTVVDKNIMVAPSNNVALLIVDDSNSTDLTNNLTFDGTVGQPSVQTASSTTYPTATNGNLLGVDPQFVRPGVDITADFHLLPTSPALGLGAYGRTPSTMTTSVALAGSVTDSATGNVGSFSVIVPTYDPDVNSILSRMPAMQTTTTINAIIAAVASLKSTLLWPVCTAFVPYWMGDGPSSLINWKGTAQTPFLSGTPTFTPYGGFLSNGSGSGVDTGVAPSALDLFALSVFSHTSGQTASAGVGGYDWTTTGFTMSLRSTADQLSGRANDNTADAVSNTDGSGLFTLLRYGSSNKKLYIRGSVAATLTTPHVALPTATMGLGFINGGGVHVSQCSRQWGAHVLRTAASANGWDTDESNLNTILTTLHGAVGA